MKLDDFLELELVHDALEKVTYLYHHFNEMSSDVLKEKLDEARCSIFNIKYGTTDSRLRVLKKLLEKI